MRHSTPSTAVLAVLALTACDRPMSTVGLEPDATSAPIVVEPLAITAPAFFALDVLPFPSEAVGVSAVNDAGQMAGIMASSTTFQFDRDYFFDPTSGFTEIPKRPTSPGTFAVDLSESGEVAGTTACPASDPCDERPYRWSSGVTTEIVTGDDRSRGYAINASGVIAGESGPDFAPWKAARWLADGSFEPLPLVSPADPGGYSRARDMNAAGTIVFDAEDDEGRARPFIWTEADGTRWMSELETAAAAAAGSGELDGVTPSVINDDGDILVWWRVDGESNRRAFLYGSDGSVVHFDFPGMDVVPVAMNNLSEVVLRVAPSATSFDGVLPMFWSSDVGFVTLPKLADHTLPSDINNLGLIVGSSDGTPIAWRQLTSAGDALTELEDVLDTVLSGGTVDVEGANGLEAKLQSVRTHLEAGRVNAARNQLEAFVNQVQAMVADGRMSEEDGAALLLAADALRALIS